MSDLRETQDYLAEVIADRDRLRAALERIASVTPTCGIAHYEAQLSARAALAGQSQGLGAADCNPPLPADCPQPRLCGERGCEGLCSAAVPASASPPPLWYEGMQPKGNCPCDACTYARSLRAANQQFACPVCKRPEGEQHRVDCGHMAGEGGSVVERPTVTTPTDQPGERQ